MCQITKKLQTAFSDTKHFQFLVHALEKQDNAGNVEILGHLNPLHPFLVHYVDHAKSVYLNSLNNNQQDTLLQQLVDNKASYLVFSDKKSIPPRFLLQTKLSLIITRFSANNVYEALKEKLKYLPIAETSFHGSFVIVYGKGLLITGDSGAGKSSLLLALLARGHLWVCDDLVPIKQNQNKDIYAEYNPSISQYIHVKGIGAIDLDLQFGKAKRIPHHSLAAIIHLSDNIAGCETGESVFTACKMTTVLDQKFPRWCIHQEHQNQVVLVETLAKQLILSDWGENAAESLITAHNLQVK